MTRASSLESLFAAQLGGAAIPFTPEFMFGEDIGRKWRADFLVYVLDHEALVEIQGTGPQGRHGSYGHHDSDCEKFSTAAALGYRVLPLSAKMVRDGSGLALVEAALGLKAIPVKEKKPRARSKLPRPARKGKLPERVRRAAGLP